MPVYEVALQAPGEAFEPELVIRAAAKVDGVWVVDEMVGVYVPYASHGLNEGTPLPKIGGKTRAEETAVHGHAGAVEAVGIEHKPEVRKAGKWKIFGRPLPAAIRLLVSDVCHLTVSNSAVNISPRQELCRHRDREQHKTNKRQHGGSDLGHELFLPGDEAGKNFHFIQRNSLDAVYRMGKMSRRTKFI